MSDRLLRWRLRVEAGRIGTAHPIVVEEAVIYPTARPTERTRLPLLAGLDFAHALSETVAGVLCRKEEPRLRR